MTTGPTGDLLRAVRRALGPRWQIDTDHQRVHIHHRDAGSPYHPPRRPPDWPSLLARLETAFARHGVPRVPPLPLRWGRETDFTISAVQALDPYLKHRKPFTYRQGYLPQPVIRFTGHRNDHGQLLDGFLTSFVNISRIQPIRDLDEHADIIDHWLDVLSSLGLHARHIDFTGHPAVWTRGPVNGITLHIRHTTIPIGDVVLLWNTHNHNHLVTDLGSGLERLRWAITRQPWPELVFGAAAHRSGNGAALDALRTATLAIASGIFPSARSPGNALRRLLRPIPTNAIAARVGPLVRHWHTYWSLTTPLQLDWPHVSAHIEDEIFTSPQR